MVSDAVNPLVYRSTIMFSALKHLETRRGGGGGIRIRECDISYKRILQFAFVLSNFSLDYWGTGLPATGSEGFAVQP